MSDQADRSTHAQRAAPVFELYTPPEPLRPSRLLREIGTSVLLCVIGVSAAYAVFWLLALPTYRLYGAMVAGVIAAWLAAHVSRSVAAQWSSTIHKRH